jgi:hypothetical protein
MGLGTLLHQESNKSLLFLIYPVSVTGGLYTYRKDNKNIFHHCGQLAGILVRISWEYPFNRLKRYRFLPRKRADFKLLIFQCQRLK